ncbi:MAG TPA: hypothetical protein VNA14_12325 [Mycobacteriales bacterium]|nr:hypothetical protein [Mycobacteriales bacterium]
MSEPVGALGDEAAKLFAAAEQWWRDTHDRGEHADAEQPHAGPECAVCPVCQLLSALRTSRPELFEHLSAAATSLMHAVRSTFESSGASWTPREGAPVVERIDIR